MGQVFQPGPFAILFGNTRLVHPDLGPIMSLAVLPTARPLSGVSRFWARAVGSLGPVLFSGRLVFSVRHHCWQGRVAAFRPLRQALFSVFILLLPVVDISLHAVYFIAP